MGMGRKDYIRELNIEHVRQVIRLKNELILGHPEDCFPGHLDIAHGILGDLPLPDLEGWIRVKGTPGNPVGFAEWEYLEEIRHRHGLKVSSVHLMSVDLTDLERAAAVRRRAERLDGLIG